MAAGALSGLQKRYRVGGWHRCAAGWRLAPYPAYKNDTGSEGDTDALPDGGLRLIRPTKTVPGRRMAPMRCRMAAGALSGLQKRYRVGGWHRCSSGWRLAPYPAYKNDNGPEDGTDALPEGGLRLIRPTKAVPGCCRPDKRLRAIRHNRLIRLRRAASHAPAVPDDLPARRARAGTAWRQRTDG